MSAIFAVSPALAAERDRAAAVAATRALYAALSANDSASEVLRQWCAARRLASPAVIRAHKVAGARAIPGPDVLRRLGVAGPDAVAYRRVRLSCGAVVLSVADNWYRPDLLTPEMNRRLATTDTPFGVVVAPLGFRRRRLGGVELAGASERVTPPFVLRQRAVLETAAGDAFSLVVERYTRAAVVRPPDR